MKQIRLILVLLSGLLLFAQCIKDEDDEQKFSIVPVPQRNTILPTNVDTLRILAFGNSFTEDGTHYLKEIIKSTDIDLSRICLYEATKSSYSLEQWYEEFASDSEINLSRIIGSIKMKDRATANELLEQNWDIVVFQQYSRLSDRFNTFNPYLSLLTSRVTSHCTNPDVCIVWQMTWNYWTENKSYPVKKKRYFDIVNATKKMMKENGITAIIPTGTAIENARNSSLQTDYDLTRDGTHLAYGTGRYVASCTWFQTLIKPAFGIDIRDTKTTFKITEEKRRQAEYPDGIFDVTDSNYGICQQCAVMAVENPFAISPID